MIFLFKHLLMLRVSVPQRSFAVLVTVGRELACRYWVAYKEGLDGTWITAYAPFKQKYGTDGTLDAAAVRSNISKPALDLASIYWALTTASCLPWPRMHTSEICSLSNSNQ